MKPPEREPQFIIGNQINHIEHQHRVYQVRERFWQIRRLSHGCRPTVTESPVRNPDAFGVGIKTINFCVGKKG